MTDDYRDSLVNKNLWGPYKMTKACIPHLQRCASIVNASSTAGIRASPDFVIYNATKFGVIGFSKSMVMDLGTKGVTVYMVAPGLINMLANASVVDGADVIKRIEQRIVMRRLGIPEEVADTVVFLFSEQSRWVNGAVIEVTVGM